MSKLKDTDYLCLTAMLRAREAKMLTGDKAERMLTEPTFADACRLAADCGYPDMSEMNTAQIDEALAAHRRDEINDIADIVPDKALVDLFRVKYDYHSAKVLIKSAGAESDSRRLLSGEGRVPSDELASAYDTSEMSSLPAVLAAAMTEAQAALSRTGNPQLADMILDKAYFAEIARISAGTGNAFIKGYVRLLIDSANLRTLIRARRMGRKTEYMSEVLIDGGEYSVSSLIEACESGDGIARLYNHTALSEAAVLGVEALAGGPMTGFERAADNAINGYLADAERIGFGPAPVVSYIAAVEAETMALRIILTGLRMGIEPGLLRERLRDSYV